MFESERATIQFSATDERLNAASNNGLGKNNGPGKRHRGASSNLAEANSGNRARSAFYLASWGTLALAAGTYLTAFIVKPHYLANWFPAVDRALTLPQGNDQDRSGVIAEAQQLRANLDLSQAEVSRLHQELGSRDAQVKSAEMRISSLEKELASVRANGVNPAAAPKDASITASLNSSNGASATAGQTSGDDNRRALAAAIGAPTDKAHSAAVQGSAPQSFEIVNGAPTMVNVPVGPPTFTNAAPGNDVELPLPERRPAGLGRTTANPITQVVRPTVAVAPAMGHGIETGSISNRSKPAEPTQPVTFSAPVVTRSANPVGIRLTAAPSLDALRLSWTLMSERYAFELTGLEPRYITSTSPAAPYSLVAGPLTDEPEAKRRCALLIARGIPCSVDSFNGNAL